jgi:FkbM family methyltransferase
MKYSQNNEQAVIACQLAVCGMATGKLLDIGAYDPAVFSNSRALLDLGWSGVLVEPSPQPFIKLLEHYRSNPKVSLVNAAVTVESGICPFFDSSGDAISTLSPAHTARWSNVAYSHFFVHTIALCDLLSFFGCDFNFINIDVEGGNCDLFDKLPLERLPSLRLICIEHDGHEREICERAALFHFRPVYCNGENLILRR